MILNDLLKKYNVSLDDLTFDYNMALSKSQALIDRCLRITLFDKTTGDAAVLLPEVEEFQISVAIENEKTATSASGATVATFEEGKTAEITGKGDVLGYEMDGLQTYFQNVIAVIDSYTNIDIGNGDTVQNYDALQEHGIVRLILANIGDDLTEWTRVWNLTSEDFYQKHFTTRGWLESAWQKIVGGLARLRENTIMAFTEALEENPDLGDMLKGIGVDAEKLLQKKENEDDVEQGEKS